MITDVGFIGLGQMGKWMAMDDNFTFGYPMKSAYKDMATVMEIQMNTRSLCP